MEATAQQKVALRQEMFARLGKLSAADVRQASAAVWERLAQLPEFSNATFLLSYVSMPPEIETHGLIQQLLAMGRRVCVPKFDADRKSYQAAELLDFHQDLEAGRMGILEPKSSAVRFVELKQVEALLIPGLAFSVKGDRIGRGMGYFDRILADTPGVKIVLAHNFQVVPAFAIHSHDVPVDFIVTETRAIDCRKGAK